MIGVNMMLEPGKAAISSVYSIRYLSNLLQVLFGKQIRCNTPSILDSSLCSEMHWHNTAEVSTHLRRCQSISNHLFVDPPVGLYAQG